MASCVSLVNGGIFNFAKMWGFSSFGLYLREIVQRVHSSTSRYLMNCVQITEKHFAVLRLLQKIPAKSPLLLTALGVVKMTTPISQHKSAKNFTVLVVDKISITTFTHQNRCTQNGHDHFIQMKRLYNI